MKEEELENLLCDIENYIVTNWSKPKLHVKSFMGNRNIKSHIGKTVKLNANCELGKEYCDWIVVDKLTKKLNTDVENVDYVSQERNKNYHKLPNIFYLCLSLNDKEQKLYLDDKIIKGGFDENGIIICDARWEIIREYSNRKDETISLLPYRYETYKNRGIIPDTTCINTNGKNCWYTFRNHHGGSYNINEHDGFLTFSNCYNFNI